MLSAWTHHLKDPDEKVRYEKSLIHSRWILEDLTKLLNQMKEDLEKSERSPKSYDLPNWDYRQAHCNGFMQCLYKIQNLLSLDHKDKQ